MKSRFSILFFLCFISQHLFASTISPVTLRKLVRDSEIIVYADVVDVKSYELIPGKRTALLVVKEYLQGNFSKDTLLVTFWTGSSCPKVNETYEANKSVLAFLDNPKLNDEFFTHGMYYGCRMLNDEDYPVYKSRIIEMQEILVISDEKVKFLRTVDWLIDCASNPQTHWDGVYDLDPHKGFMFENSSFMKKNKTLFDFSDEQILKLRIAFLNCKQIETYDDYLIDIIKVKNDTELLNYLILQAKNNEPYNLWYKDFLIRRIAEISKRKDLKKKYKEINELEYTDADLFENHHKLTSQFLEMI